MLLEGKRLGKPRGDFKNANTETANFRTVSDNRDALSWSPPSEFRGQCVCVLELIIKTMLP